MDINVNNVVDSAEYESAHQQSEMIISIAKQIRTDYVKLGYIVKEFRSKKKYLSLGYETFAEWYEGSGLSTSMVYRSLDRVEKYIETLDVDPNRLESIDVRKTDVLTPLIKEGIIHKGNAGDWMDKAETLSTHDLILEVNRAKGYESNKEKMAKSHNLQGYYLLVKAKGIDTGNLGEIHQTTVRFFETSDGELLVRI